MSECFEIITNELCEDRSIEEQVFVDNIKERFYNDLIEKFLSSLPTLLFRFLIEKGAGHIVEPRLLIRGILRYKIVSFSKFKLAL